MKCTFSCKKVSLNDSIKDYAEKKISKLDRYFQEEPTAFVTFSVEKSHLCSAEITIRGAGTLLRAQTEAPDGDMRGAVDAACGYIERQILKNKTRLAKKLRSEALPASAPLMMATVCGAPAQGREHHRRAEGPVKIHKPAGANHPVGDGDHKIQSFHWVSSYASSMISSTSATATGAVRLMRRL